MDARHLVILILQISIIATVFGFGLKTTMTDLMYLVRRPGLLLRSLIAMLVIMPLVAVTLDRVFDFSHTVEVALVALSISPVPPLLPQREAKAGGHQSYGLALMAILALFSIVLVPLALKLLELIYQRPYAAPGAI